MNMEIMASPWKITGMISSIFSHLFFLPELHRHMFHHFQKKVFISILDG